MKILYWTSRFWPEVGGIEVLSLETLRALQQRGYEFTVIANTGIHAMPAYCEQDGIPVYRFDFLSALASRDIQKLIAIQRQIAAIKASFRADLVHLNLVGAGAYFHLKTHKTHPTPLLAATHSDLSQSSGGPDTVYGQCLRDADWICSVSRATLDDILKLVPEQASRSSVIPNGLAMPALPPTPLPFVAPHIVCLGRIVHQKGFDIALRAFASLLHGFPTARFTLVGEGEMRSFLESQVAALRLEAHVTFTGRLEREDIAPMLNTATMVVVPSRYREPFALVALEAAQMARPVVATRWGGLVETVADGQSGILVENENVAAFADAMTFLLKNPDIARTMGEQGRERAQQLFSLQRCVDDYDVLYRKIGARQ